ncbi:MAG: OmpA family protein [Myxococcota bacterium]
MAAVLLAVMASAGGCHGPNRAKTYAAYRSGCAPDEVEVVEQDDHDLILDVCGVYEDWKWNALDGWVYEGPSAKQPQKAPVVVDTDGDGIPDANDKCPQEKGLANNDPALNGCPAPKDADGDGIPDDRDACPQQAGVQNVNPQKNGCPAPGDADGDGVTDDVDACPQVAGVAQPDPAKNGCPADRDGDSIVDADDACPDEAGVANADPRINGCPAEQKVIVTRQEIVITQKIQFAVGLSTIKPVSFSLLDEIAAVMKKHPEVLKVEVQGHTDNTGSEGLNRRLSQARADAVVAALVQRGVEAGRLTAKGYGPDKPLTSNDTDEGKATNRRVQFEILEKKPLETTTTAPPEGAAPAAPAPP